MQVKLLHISDLHYRMQYKSSNKAFAYDSIFPNMVPPMQQLDICLQKMGEKGTGTAFSSPDLRGYDRIWYAGGL